MRNSAAARRYARALFGLALDDGRVEEIRGQLADLDRLFRENHALREAVLTPLHPAAERRAVLRALTAKMQTDPVLGRFCAFLLDQRRLVDFAGIRQSYDRLADEASGRVDAQVVSASPLDDAQREDLLRALSRRTGREVQLEVRVDPALIGGAIAVVGDLVFDGSLRSQLGQLRANLTKEF